MEFRINENGIDGINEEGKVMAQITYEQIEEGVYNINHTFVDESLRGQKIGQKLVELAIDEINKKSARIVATCSYARHYLEKHGYEMPKDLSQYCKININLQNKKSIILASNNKNKLKEMKEKLQPLGFEVLSQKEAGFDIEVEETGTTFKENAILKAEAIYAKLKSAVIADDSGLEIDCLNGMPGVYSHRYAGENATDDDRINKVLKEMKNVEDNKRTARFRCLICYIDNKGEKHIFEGVVEGKIATKKQGYNGFGYDPIFICEKGKTFAELSSDEKNEISHRGRAVEKFIHYINKNQ